LPNNNQPCSCKGDPGLVADVAAATLMTKIFLF